MAKKATQTGGLVKVEQTRFKDYYGTYLANTPSVSATASMALSGSAKGNKVRNSRKQIYGETGLSRDGMHTVKDASKQKTQSGQKK